MAQPGDQGSSVGGAWRVWAGDPSGRTAVVRGTPRIGLLVPELLAAGMTLARTGALSEPAAAHLTDEGWDIAGRLHLLQHDLQRMERPWRGAFRKGRGAHLSEIAAVDRSAFPTEWQLGLQGLTEALAATPRSRIRIHRQGGAITAFAISGMAGGDGYLQRLAVVEALRRDGVGRQLTLDALRWMRRRRARRALVNTYEGNDAALRLYEGVGFHELSPGLVVLSIAL